MRPTGGGGGAGGGERGGGGVPPLHVVFIMPAALPHGQLESCFQLPDALGCFHYFPTFYFVLQPLVCIYHILYLGNIYIYMLDNVA